jgi:hypothetical protein
MHTHTRIHAGEENAYSDDDVDDANLQNSDGVARISDGEDDFSDGENRDAGEEDGSIGDDALSDQKSMENSGREEFDDEKERMHGSMADDEGADLDEE